MYNMPECARVRGSIDLDLLKRAVHAVVNRHEAWRTTFASLDGMPVQRVHANLAPQITWETLPVSAADLETAAHARLSVLCSLPFDLVRGPLVRVHIITLAPNDHFLLLNVHHMVSDGWSTSIFAEEFTTHYLALLEGRTPSLPDPPLQYGDYAVWQKRTHTGSEFEALTARLARTLGSDHGYASLPLDRPRPQGADDSGDFLLFEVGRERTQTLHALAQRHGVTLFVVLSAAFKTALLALTGHPNVALGVPLAGRNKVELERVIGLFANTAVLRTDLSDDPTFAEVLRRERAVWISAHAHQDVPFERLVERLGPVRSLSRNPLFQIMFILQNTPRPTIQLPNATVGFIATGTRSVKFDMVLELYENKNGLRGWIGYLSSLFPERTVQRLLSRFRAVLDDLPLRSDRKLSANGATENGGDIGDFMAPL